MKRNLIVAISVLLISAIVLCVCFSYFCKPPEKVENFRVVAYIRGEYVQTPYALYAEDFDIITDVILFECASFNNKGEIVYDNVLLETALSNIRTAIGDRDVKITLNLLGPGGQTDSSVWEDQMEAQSIEHNKAFESGVLEKNIINILDKYDFDGVHFDYEYPISNESWKAYNKFLVSLDKQLGDYTLGVAFVDWNNKFSRAAAKAVDYFELMTYDFVDENGRHATYEHTVNVLEKTKLKYIEPAKVHVGLPFYARPSDMDAYWYGYNGYYEEINEDGWYHCNETNKDFWFNTPEVIEKKTDYAINNGYGGVMIWHYNCDLPSTHKDSLIRSIGIAKSNNY